jgi:hypothetical protein
LPSKTIRNSVRSIGAFNINLEFSVIEKKEKMKRSALRTFVRLMQASLAGIF